MFKSVFKLHRELDSETIAAYRCAPPTDVRRRVVGVVWATAKDSSNQSRFRMRRHVLGQRSRTRGTPLLATAS